MHVTVLREKDCYQSDGEAYVVERPVYTPVYRRVDEQGNIIDEGAPVAQEQQQVVYVNAEAAKPQGNVYVNTEAAKPQDSVYANVGDLQLNVNVSGPDGQ